MLRCRGGRLIRIKLAIIAANNHYAGCGPGTANVFRNMASKLELKYSNPGYQAMYDLALLRPYYGFELHQEINKKDKKIKAYFVYELYFESLKQEFPNLNVGCFIPKPIDIDDRIKRIKQELV